MPGGSQARQGARNASWPWRSVATPFPAVSSKAWLRPCLRAASTTHSRAASAGIITSLSIRVASGVSPMSGCTSGRECG